MYDVCETGSLGMNDSTTSSFSKQLDQLPNELIIGCETGYGSTVPDTNLCSTRNILSDADQPLPMLDPRWVTLPMKPGSESNDRSSTNNAQLNWESAGSGNELHSSPLSGALPTDFDYAAQNLSEKTDSARGSQTSVNVTPPMQPFVNTSFRSVVSPLPRIPEYGSAELESTVGTYDSLPNHFPEIPPQLRARNISARGRTELCESTPTRKQLAQVHEFLSASCSVGSQLVSTYQGSLYSTLLSFGTPSRQGMSSSGTNCDYIQPTASTPLPVTTPTRNSRNLDATSSQSPIFFDFSPASIQNSNVSTFNNNHHLSGFTNINCGGINHYSAWSSPVQPEIDGAWGMEPNRIRPVNGSASVRHSRRRLSSGSFHSCAVHSCYKARYECLNPAHRRARVCCVCLIEKIGNHGGCKVNSLTEQDCKRGSNIQRVNILVKALESTLSEVGVECAFSSSQKYMHKLFDTDTLKQRGSLSQSLLQVVQLMNDLIIRLNTYEVKHDDFKERIEYVFESFRLSQELRSLQAPETVVPARTGRDSPDINRCYFVGHDSFEAVRGLSSFFYVKVLDFAGRPCKSGRYPFSVHAYRASDGRECQALPMSIQDGVTKVSFSYDIAGSYVFHVTVNSLPVPGSPFEIRVKTESKFKRAFEETIRLGGPDTFNKPWGICVDKKSGDLYVADRNSHNIKVFAADCMFKFQFSSKGSEIGKVNKPCGLVVDGNDNLVVCDKDNHRLQVFTIEGTPLRVSGISELFKYPWDIAVNSRNEYIVTHQDAVSVMSSEFEQLRRISMPKHPRFILQPRGVCCGVLEEFYFTEFQTASVYVVNDKSNKPVKLFETQGYWGTPKRLQGIFMDPKGYFLIADSKNNAIEVYTAVGEFIKRWPVDGKAMKIVKAGGPDLAYIVSKNESDHCSIALYRQTVFSFIEEFNSVL